MAPTVSVDFHTMREQRVLGEWKSESFPRVAKCLMAKVQKLKAETGLNWIGVSRVD